MFRNALGPRWELVPASAPPARAPQHPGARTRPSAVLFAGAGDSGEEDRTVRAGRRRRSGAPGPERRERAEAPQRRDAGGGATPPSGSGSGGEGGSGRNWGSSGPQRPTGGLPGGGKLSPGLSLIVLLIVLAVVVGPMLFGGNDDTGSQPDVVQEPLPTQVAFEPTLAAVTGPEPAASPAATRAAPAATRTPRPTAAAQAATPAGNAGDQRWLIMLYQDADDKILEQDIYLDLNEAERVGSSAQVQMVAQVDRYRGGFQGDGNWSDTRRYYISRDRNLNRLNSEVVDELGEVNMAAGESLVDFVTWAARNYPADKYVLILSDHGMGWPGGWSDADAGNQRPVVDRNIPLSQLLGDELYLNELDAALETARQRAGIDKFELIGMDACLMGHVEVLSALAPHGRYAVLSQETEPAVGWAYTAFLTELSRNPGVSGAELGRSIVESYIEQDQRVVDDAEREAWVGRSMGGFGGAPSAAQLTAELGRGVTLTAVDLAAVPSLIEGLNGLAYELQQVPQQAVAKARSYTQSFTSIFGRDVPASYIDLGHFVALLGQVSREAGIRQAGNSLLAALQEAVIAEKHGPEKKGATGLSIYFPNSQLYRNPAAGPQSYTAIARRFAEDTLWDEFLAFHYAGRSFEPDTRLATVPEQSEITRAPGSGRISATPLEKSADAVDIRNTVLLRTRVSGENVGYIYFFTGYLDRQSNSIFVADQDYLEAPQTREVNGVFYPDWGEGDFNLEFEWEPLAYAITDGTESVQAALRPETYGASYEETIYTVDGNYTYAEDGEERRVRAYFRDGRLRQIFAFTGDDATGGAWEVTPQNGDTLTVLETWLEPDGQGGTRTVTQEGGALRFSGEPILWQELDAAAGEYVVGFIIQDLDGNSTEVYTQITVR